MQGVLPNVVGGLQETVKLANGTTRSPGTLVWERFETVTNEVTELRD